LTLATLGTGVAQTAAKKTWTALRTSDGQPDLQGIWNSATGTPVERPAELKEKEFFTPQEARDWEKTMQARSKRDGKGTIPASRNIQRRLWEIEPSRSRLSEPPSSSIPPMGNTGADTAAAPPGSRRPTGSIIRWTGGPGAGRSVPMFSTGAPPMKRFTGNSNYRIVQTKDYVAIYIEMIHDTRIIRSSRV
jgi:hypothetical protein